MTHEELNALTATYAVDALEGEELAAVEAHLETCDICRADLDTFRETLAALVPDSPATAEGWDRIVAEIESTEMGAIGTSDAAGVASPIDLDAFRRERRWGWITAVAAAVAVVVGGLAIFQQLTIADLTGPQAVALAAERAAAEPGTFSEDFEVDGVAVARVILTTDGRGFVVPTEDLPALPSERAYQLWVINDQEAVISAGVLGSDPVAATFTWTGTVSGFALTREIAGGVVSSEGDVVSVITGA